MGKGRTFRKHEVLALLEGRKTLMHLPIKGNIGNTVLRPPMYPVDDEYWWGPFGGEGGMSRQGFKPYYKVGDQIWVREKFMAGYNSSAGAIKYAADGHIHPGLGDFELMSWCMPVSMPQWASRMTLEITDISTQHIQSITPLDLVESGIEVSNFEIDCNCERCPRTIIECPPAVEVARAKFKVLWNKMHGTESWDSNPVVWRYRFKRIK